MARRDVRNSPGAMTHSHEFQGNNGKCRWCHITRHRYEQNPLFCPVVVERLEAKIRGTEKRLEERLAEISMIQKLLEEAEAELRRAPERAEEFLAAVPPEEHEAMKAEVREEPKIRRALRGTEKLLRQVEQIRSVCSE